MDELLKDDYEEVFRIFKEKQLQQVRTNEKLRTALLEIAEEGAELGIIWKKLQRRDSALVFSHW